MKTKNPLISVIVPVYNVQNYLEQCLDSILNQGISDIEVICVNDGSTDNSLQILRKYQKNDKRIKIINQKNKGLSSARNAGLKTAKGEFINFTDSDDWCDLAMFERLYKNITELNTDIVICSTVFYDNIYRDMNANQMLNLNYSFDKKYENKAFSCIEAQDMLMDIPIAAWAKLYRHSFLKKVNAKFVNGMLFEDAAFSFSLFFKTQKISIEKELLYYHRMSRADSIVNNTGKNYFSMIKSVNLMFEYLKNSPIFDNCKYNFYKKKIQDIIYTYKKLPDELKKEYASKFKAQSYLANKDFFDFSFIEKEFTDLYNEIKDIQNNSDDFYYLKYKFLNFFRVRSL